MDSNHFISIAKIRARFAVKDQSISIIEAVSRSTTEGPNLALNLPGRGWK